MNKEGETITFSEACKILGKSERTLFKYIRKDIINPGEVRVTF
ncbi:helix-turn-helix domain-containing protein [bacterium]|nr:helix-turn-helix domain-containing protein [bacterium]MBU4510773.1 helix-turn-helix domain-containing protein [bacterium]